MSTPLLEATIGDTLRRQARERGDRPALQWPDGDGMAAMSYRELLDVAELIAAFLLDRASTGEVVASWSRNSLDGVLLEHGCALAGVVLAPFNPMWTDAEVTHALELVEPRLVLVGAAPNGQSLLDRAQRLAGADRVVVLDDLRALATGPKVELPQLTPDAPFLIQFTSGTTGRAKGALLSHRSGLNSGYLRASVAGANETDVWLNPVPLHHIGGSCSMVLGVLSVGASYVVLPRFDVAQMVHLLTAGGATRTGGVPTMLTDLMAHPDFPTEGLNIRSVGLGGTSVDPDVVRRVERAFGCKAAVVYAQSECPAVSSTMMDDDVETIATTVGRPGPQTEVRLVAPGTTDPVPLGEVGELCVRSPLVMLGYYRMPEATAAAFDVDGFLHTGDLASMTPDGTLTIKGRSREVIIRGGENIYPVEVEHALLDHPDVVSAAVVGRPDARLGQRVGAAVILKSGTATTSTDLAAFVAERIARYKVPVVWRIVDSLPLTASGKIRKIDLGPIFDDAARVDVDGEG